MFKNDITERYHILDRDENQWYLCRNREELIDFISHTIFRWSSWDNKLKKDYSMFDFSGNDIRYIKGTALKMVKVRDYEAEREAARRKEIERKNNELWHRTQSEEESEEIPSIYKWEYCYVPVFHEAPRRYLVVDGHQAIIDIRKFEKEVLVYRNSKKSISHRDKCDNAEHGEFVEVPCWRKMQKVQRFRFREDPVPNIHSHKHYHAPNHGHCAQLVKTEGLRPKCHLPFVPCKYRHTDSNWKSSFKCKHQWEKHMVRKSKGHNVYVMKNAPEYDDFSAFIENAMYDTLNNMMEEADVA